MSDTRTEGLERDAAEAAAREILAFWELFGRFEEHHLDTYGRLSNEVGVHTAFQRILGSVWPDYQLALLARRQAADNGQAHPDSTIALRIVTLAEFAATSEDGADPLLGDRDNILIPANGDVMVYGDGGAGKTTLCMDLACHLAAGVPWLGINVANPLRVLLVENEGPRPLFRAKVERKLGAWTGGDLGGRLHVVEEPWAQLSLALRPHRVALAKAVARHDIDVVMIGPLAAAGMNDAGTLREVRDFIALCSEVRQLAGRAVTFVLIHHENKGGKVSGAWEGAADTLLHVQGMGAGRTRLHVQKARWSPRWHAQTLELDWTPGESFTIADKPELADDDVIEQLLAVIGSHPGTGWRNVEELTPGIRAGRRRRLRDRLLADGAIVNVIVVGGVRRVVDQCPERRPAQLYAADDPTIRGVPPLRPSADADGTQAASAGEHAEKGSASLRPDNRRDAGRDAAPEGAPTDPGTDPNLFEGEDRWADEIGEEP